MNVSRRHIAIVLGATAGAALMLAGLAFAGGGSGCCKGGGQPGVPVPGINVTPPNVTGGGMMGGGSMGCCGLPKTHGVIVPGINVPAPNVTVTTPNVVVNQGSVSVGGTQFVGGGVSFGGSASSGGFIVGGGGGYYSQPGVGQSLVGDLNVEGGDEFVTELVSEQVPVTENACVDQIRMVEAIRPVRADCIDDNGTPHPASRVDDGKEVKGSYTGEIFRCMAGTRMQVTVGEMVEGKASFDRGQSFACAKGEALVHKAGGELVCAAQTPQRNCNERSLLRRYGPGEKLIRMSAKTKTCIPTTRTVTQTVTREVTRVKPTASAPIVFDGGVGQGY